MGFYFRKSISFGPLRMNLSKGGVGFSAGVRGLRVGTGPRGAYVQAGMGGVYYRQSLNAPRSRRRRRVAADTPPIAISDPRLQPMGGASIDSLAQPDDDGVLASINHCAQGVAWEGWVGLGVSAVLALTGLIILPDAGVAAIVALLLAPVVLVYGGYKAHIASTMVLLYDLDDDVLSAYQRLHDALTELNGYDLRRVVTASIDGDDPALNPSTAWRSIRVQRTPPSVIRANVPVLTLPGASSRYVFLPDRVLITNRRAYADATYADLHLALSTTRCALPKQAPADLVPVDHTWEHARLDGEPDRRFRDNARIPIYEVATLDLRTDQGVHERYWASKPEAFAALKGAIATLATLKRVAPRTADEDDAARV